MNKALIDLAQAVASKKPAGEFSYDEMHETFREQLAELVLSDEGKIDYYKWANNKNLVFQIMGVMVDEILPKNVRDAFMRFADVQSFPHGTKVRFQLKTGRANVKRFVTKVAVAGVYERVRLDKTYVDVETYAHGGAVYQTLEGFLTGRESVSEVLDILIEGLEEALYADVATALKGSIDSMPAANKHEHTAFNATEFNRVLATIRAYGTPVILCTQEFAGTLTPADGFVGDADRADMRNLGYIGKINGAEVVVIPQSFTDETNTVKQIDPQTAYIIPAGSMEAPIKVALEGQTMIREKETADWGVEIQVFKKLGISLLNTNYFGAYTNTSLT
jgi:hypothetical protein